LVIALIAIYLILSRSALPQIASVLAERQGTITNDIAAAEELKLRAQEAEEAYETALANARAEANKIAEETRAKVQADLDAELGKADAQIAERTAESEKAIAEIRDSAAETVTEVAKDVAKDLVTVFGAKADARTVTAAVTARMKG